MFYVYGLLRNRQLREIIQDTRTQTKIAEDWGISQSMVSKIKQIGELK